MKVTILTEGGTDRGFGHITRCIALSQGLEKNGHRPKLIINADNSISRLMAGSNFRLLNWVTAQESILNLVKNTDFVIIDSYLAKKVLYDKISEMTEGNLLMIDDYKRLEYPRGIVVNPSICGDRLKYPRKEGVKYLLGKDYIILRKEFWEVPVKKIRKEIKNVLITFGGMRQRRLATQIAQSLKQVKDCEFHIAGNSGENLNAKQMLEQMLEADLCISGGGQTTNELARVGVPTIGMCFAENQLINLEGWEKSGFLKYAGWYDKEALIGNILGIFSRMIPYDTRVKINMNGRNGVDGQGAGRISALLNTEVA